MRAWERLLADGDGRDGAAVRSLIHQSWTRCASGGTDAQCSEAPIETGKAEIEHRSHANGELMHASRRTFAGLGRLLDGTGAMLTLADAEGVLVDVIGDYATMRRGMDIHLAVGGKWTEDAVGTNGIGTALLTGEPVYVHAAEHFCAGIKGWTCAGAPIRDPIDGAILGVVDLSGPPDIFRPHNTALVAAAAREIEKALADQQNENRLRLLEAFIANAPNYRRRDGLAIVDHRGRLVYANNLPDAVARDFFKPTGGGAVPRRFEVRRADGRRGLDLGGALPEAMKSCHVSDLAVEGGLRGVALVFPERASEAEHRPLPRPLPRLREGAAAAIVGESAAIREAVDLACRVAETPEVTSLLIEGETGVGKELFARLVHQGCRKSAAAAFVAVNCGAITHELFGSELFGHVAGAFTGATKEGKPGVFELANGGVLSLDEIGEMPLEIQPFLLRVLEERVVHRIGDSRPRPVDVRLIASTNRNLRREVEQGRFRRDLYYRISTVSIRVPPLREREGDVPLLLQHFNERIAGRSGRPALVFEREVVDHLAAHTWPGNVRELRNLVERLHVLRRDDTVRLEDLPAEMLETPAEPAAATAMPDGPKAGAQPAAARAGEIDRQRVMDALAAEGGNLSRVALRLGISRPTLYRKLEQYGIRRGFV
ncbi:acetoin dehydrogenase operon transcriptional activator AcoR [Pleomorphomonas sp. SM30]|uniref:Transcriptional regulator of acetoin/glycerol metabolism n=2 Tax=Oharaeibacter diazotrophicus TaxID=1920512 RepID=A0A4R6RF87_9HYPH|nr:transcriptional regulator of acetoin/glycerol metabolism [Oharaeibacter diazotrophicus]BBE73923.1 acetoin dehydrogenase operon transcriptional activator AcoR [Pleomorphomonas sp. SM30]GLS76392.1 sigma-54-dependent Fis family transcriptional regulator [Oharaeibacter diazotrophicus]